jgi:U3 small nucleolar RNA-associated protein 22
LQIPEAVKSLQKSQKVAVPFPDPKPENNAAYNLAYSKPSKINVVGSYVLKTLIKSETAFPVEMVVVMPASIFQEKDYLNYRYFYKRAYYLACIAAALQKDAQDKFSFKYGYLHGNSLLPILILKPTIGKSIWAFISYQR